MFVTIKTQKGFRRAEIKNIGNYQKRKDYYVKKVKVRGLKNKRAVDPKNLKRNYVYDNVNKQYVKANPNDIIEVQTTEGKQKLTPLSLKKLYSYKKGIYNKEREIDRITIKEKSLSDNIRYQVRLRVGFIFNNRKVLVDGFSKVTYGIQNKDGATRKAFDHAFYAALLQFNVDYEGFKQRAEVKILKTEYLQIVQ